MCNGEKNEIKNHKTVLMWLLSEQNSMEAISILQKSNTILFVEVVEMFY